MVTIDELVAELRPWIEKVDGRLEKLERQKTLEQKWFHVFVSMLGLSKSPEFSYNIRCIVNDVSAGGKLATHENYNRVWTALNEIRLEYRLRSSAPEEYIQQALQQNFVWQDLKRASDDIWAVLKREK